MRSDPHGTPITEYTHPKYPNTARSVHIGDHVWARNNYSSTPWRTALVVAVVDGPNSVITIDPGEPGAMGVSMAVSDLRYIPKPVIVEVELPNVLFREIERSVVSPRDWSPVHVLHDEGESMAADLLETVARAIKFHKEG